MGARIYRHHSIENSCNMMVWGSGKIIFMPQYYHVVTQAVNEFNISEDELLSLIVEANKTPKGNMV